MVAESPKNERKVKENTSTSLPKSFIMITAVGIFLHFLLAIYVLPSYQQCAQGTVYNDTKLHTITQLPNGDTHYNLLVITDLDNDSKIAKSKKPAWQSYIKKGSLVITKDKQSAHVNWFDDQDIAVKSDIGAGGRGMELSDLAVFNGHLLTVDDRTGLIYKIKDNKVFPWVFLNDGPGDALKGMKGEWMTVKDNKLYVGGLGKEWTTTEGVFVNHHPMYVKVVSPDGAVQHLNWTDNYIQLRAAVGITYPGYMIHESGQWSDTHKKFFFMPRRASKDTYSEATDEFKGTNYMLIASEDFSDIQFKEIGNAGTGSRGYSAFKFVPGTDDDIIVTLKSEEMNGNPVASYISVYRLSTHQILLDETLLTGTYKFEGIEFV
uniref:Apyrase n=1 Tax=Rhabditophanes sp. KR3021 TaxID=114890 RepID=A0AC35UA18_9BILA